MPARFQTDMVALHKASNIFVGVVHRYELYRAIARNQEFVARIHNTNTAYAMTTIVGVLMTSLVISLTGLFDGDADSVSLKRILNTLLQPQAVAPLERFHRSWPKNHLNTHDALAGLKRIRSRLNSDRLDGAISRLRDLRNREVAHLGLQPIPADEKAKIGDIDLVYGVTANIIVSCNLIAAARKIHPRHFREVAQSQADIFRNSIIPL